MLSPGFGLVQKAKVVENISSRWALLMEIPRFIEDSMPHNFDGTAVAVNIPNIAIRHCITNANTTKVMAIQL